MGINENNAGLSFPQKALSLAKKLAGKIDWKCVVAVLVAFIITRMMVVVVTYLSMAQLPIRDYPYIFRYNPRNLIADGLIRWDSEHYVHTAQHGYSTDDLKAIPFFPFYSILIRFAAIFTGNIWTSGLWVSNLSFLAALFYLYAIAKREFDEEIAGRTVFYISAAPTAFFFSVVYNESVYLLLILMCFYYARNGKWLIAAIAGSLATATRLQGVFASVIILLEALWLQGFRFFPKPWSFKAQLTQLKQDLLAIPKAWKGILAAVVSLSGLFAYMIYLHYQVGDPLAFLHVTDALWGKGFSADWLPRLIKYTTLMYGDIGNLFSGEIGNFQYVLDPIFALLTLPLIVIAIFKFRPAYAMFALMSFLVPLMSGQVISMQRYVLPIVPVYFVLALWGKRKWVDRMIIGVFLPLQAYLLVLFSHWYYAG